MGYVGVPPQSGFITTAKQRVTSSTNNYVDLDNSISSLADVIVWVNSVKQDSTNLTLTTSTRITLGDTLTASDVVEIAYLGKAVATQTPDTGTVTNDMLAGSIANAKLANSSITLNGSAVSLGGSASVKNNNLFRAYNTGSQLLNNNTNTVIEMNTESFDVDSKFDTSTYKYTPSSVGYYYLNAGLYLNFNDSNLGRRMKVAIHKNGSNIAEHFFMLADSGANILNEVSINVSVVDYSSSTSDYYQVIGLQNNGNGTNDCYVIQGEPISYFQGCKLIT